MQAACANDAAWSAVATTDAAQLDRDAVADLLRSIASVRAACDAAEVLAVRRIRELRDTGAAEPPEVLLADQTGRSSKNAREAAAREEACAAMPGFEAGLANGSMSAGHLDAAAAVHARLKDEVAEQFASHAAGLLARSQQLGVDAFDRECRDLARHLTAMDNPGGEVDELERQRAASSVKRWVDRTTGMHNTLLSLDPIRDAKMWKVITNQVGRERQRSATSTPRQPFTAIQAQAFVSTVTNTSAPGQAGTAGASPTAAGCTTPSASTSARPIPSTPASDAPTSAMPTNNDRDPTGASPVCTSNNAPIRLPEISVLCDLATLTAGIRAADGVCETDDGVAIPPETVRRLACDAKIIPILLGSRGEVVDQGRRVRTATAAQRNTLAAMHQTCAFPGCTVGLSDCRMHHVRWWWKHLGRTDIDNLLPLCENHHHLVHEGGWGLTLDDTRIATWTRPDGRVHHRGSTINRQPPSFPLRE